MTSLWKRMSAQIEVSVLYIIIIFKYIILRLIHANIYMQKIITK